VLEIIKFWRIEYLKEGWLLRDYRAEIAYIFLIFVSELKK
jgi:hypothetical protein